MTVGLLVGSSWIRLFGRIETYTPYCEVRFGSVRLFSVEFGYWGQSIPRCGSVGPQTLGAILRVYGSFTIFMVHHKSSARFESAPQQFVRAVTFRLKISAWCEVYDHHL